MPRRLPVRPGKILGNIFVLLVALVMGTIYYTYVDLWGPRAKESMGVLAMLIFFNLLFVMLVWSWVQTMTTDPGQVPVFWGFHLGDPEQKRRRYCLMCNIFKPERCHHCSVCNRCVLNMDHHCPWINNCVGFWNRKYFLLLLIYVLAITYFVAITLLYDWLLSIQWGLDVYYYSTKHA
jgi:palmitoyltransferase ZDHHC2/15/20